MTPSPTAAVASFSALLASVAFAIWKLPQTELDTAARPCEALAAMATSIAF